MLEHLGNVIKDTIFIKDLNQRKVAEELRIPPQTLNAYLNNRRAPNLFTFASLMKSLEIDANEALGLYDAQRKNRYSTLLSYKIQQLSIEQQKIIIEFLQIMQQPNQNLKKYIFV